MKSKIRSLIEGYLFSRSKMDIYSVLNDFVNKNSNLSDNKHVALFWEFGGFSRILVKNAILSSALNVRGFNTHFIICDGTPIACIQCEYNEDDDIGKWQLRCSHCIREMVSIAGIYNINYSFANNYITQSHIEEYEKVTQSIDLYQIRKYKLHGINVGELAYSSLNRYMKGLFIKIDDLNENGKLIYRKFLFAALVNTHVAEKAILYHKPESIVTSHGIYVDYAPPIFIGSLKKLKCMVWDSAYKSFCHYFTIPKHYNKLQLRGLKEIEWERIKLKKLEKHENKQLDDFIFARYFQCNAADIEIKQKPKTSKQLKKDLKINNDNPIISLFAHVNWDACFDLSTMIFDSANEWIIESMYRMEKIKNVNWIIRIHPGEITLGSLFTSENLINKFINNIPENIKIIPIDSNINTYDIYQLIDAGITIFGTIGVELPLLGKPVIVAGDAHFSQKGFTLDAATKNEYFNILENAHMIHPLDENQIKLARKYAYSYFIQRQIPMNVINKSQGHWGDLDLKLLNKLLPGKDYAMDKICDGIINGKDVIL